MRADRLVAILLMLQTRGRVTAPEVAAELEVSEKTARRDLEALGMAGLPVYSQPGRNGGWRLLGGASTDLSGLTAEEARHLFLTAGAATPLDGGERHTSGILRKLLRALPETFRADAEVAAKAVVVDPSAWGDGPPAPTPEHLPVLRRAVVERVRVRISYVDRTRVATERVVDPLGLVSKGRVWYLVAGTDRGQRTFRVDRVRTAALTTERAERPADFDLRAAWLAVVAEMGERRSPARATVRVPGAYVRGLRGQFGNDLLLDEVETAPEHASPSAAGEARVTVIVAGRSPQVIAQHLAGWGAALEVLDPPEVRAHLERLGRELAQLYLDPDRLPS